MDLCVIILKEEEILDTLLKKFTVEDIKNVTVLESDTVTCEQHKQKKKDINIFGSIRYMFDYLNDESRVILIPIKSDRIEIIKEIVSDIVPKHQYILFTIAINNIEGTLE